MTSSPKFEASTAKTSLLRGGLGVGLCAIGTDAISSRSSTSSEDAKTFTESTRCLMFRAAAAAASTGSELRASCMTAEMELNLFCCVLLPSWPPPMAAAAAATALKPLDRVLGPCEEATAALKLLGRSPSSNLGRAGLSLNSWGTAHVGGRSPLMLVLIYTDREAVPHLGAVGLRSGSLRIGSPPLSPLLHDVAHAAVGLDDHWAQWAHWLF
eukprot:CAMPEP_0180505868 /NCGR_PEP_ID=MMETSP1036_2-20121128/47620_1 /TAXON_ID=632150 /ORGANISM="Azadinium spinosum, Strain 3D9" /LENGTH=211 /DNA_ID=CAMNT_0022515641 /DNA_START=36 /DNA_END=668 /DNA_ORIENTATION=+